MSGGGGPALGGTPDKAAAAPDGVVCDARSLGGVEDDEAVGGTASAVGVMRGADRVGVVTVGGVPALDVASDGGPADVPGDGEPASGAPADGTDAGVGIPDGVAESRVDPKSGVADGGSPEGVPAGGGVVGSSSVLLLVRTRAGRSG